MLVLGSLGAAYSPLFAVENIRIVGAEQLDTAAVEAALADQVGTPLPRVDADPTQIRQVVLNLIINATEAVDENGLVTVATGQEAVHRQMLSRMTFGADAEPGPQEP